MDSQVVIGILLNLFILLVILQKYDKEKSVHSGDVMRIAMNRSNIILTLVLNSSLFCFIFLPGVYNTLSVYFFLLILYSMGSSLYLTAIFCFFLFIKIVPFRSSILALVKRKVTLVIPWLVVAVEVFSFCCSFLSFLFSAVKKEVYTNSSAVPSSSITNDRRLVYLLTVALFFMPYILMAMTTILAVGSLLLHTHKMKMMKMASPINTGTYTRTVYKMISFFICHTLFCLVLFLACFSGLIGGDPSFSAIQMIMFLLLPANSLIIIYSNNKLRNAWKMMIVCHLQSLFNITDGVQ
uniref:Taste receptor type 2 n=1 Tax=Pyxicephalus adspersus TaxID=30357 RepID=A0AAV2ZW48_PYXAD|nr:TPA: hypothetical protein GDO54_014783 [Pyxicephalus adspersus]